MRVSRLFTLHFLLILNKKVQCILISFYFCLKYVAAVIAYCIFVSYFDVDLRVCSLLVCSFVCFQEELIRRVYLQIVSVLFRLLKS